MSIFLPTSDAEKYRNRPRYTEPAPSAFDRPREDTYTFDDPVALGEGQGIPDFTQIRRAPDPNAYGTRNPDGSITPRSVLNREDVPAMPDGADPGGAPLRVASALGAIGGSSYAEMLGLPVNPITEELTRPVNYIPFGKGVSVARAATEAVGGRLAQEAAQPLVEMLPESVRPIADIGVNIAGQVATGGLYGRSGGALGMGVKDVGGATPNSRGPLEEALGAGKGALDALDPVNRARRQVLEAVRKEANIRKVGTASREVFESRGVQTAGIRASAEMAQPGEDLLAAARKGAYLGGEGSGRQTYAAALDIPDDTKGLLFDDLRDQMLSGQLREFDYLRSMKALNKVISGEGLQPNEIQLVRRALGDEVANVVSARPKGLEQEVMSAAKIAEERARLDAIGRTAARDALKSGTRQSVREVEQRLRALGADTDLPIPPAPSEETMRLAAMAPERLAGDFKARAIRARKIVGAYEDGIANAAKRDAKALERSNRIIEDSIDFEAKQSAKQADKAAAQYAAVVRRQEQIRGRRLVESTELTTEAIGTEAKALRSAIDARASETENLMAGAARATRNKARDRMIEAFNQADAATIQSLRADFEALAAKETARASRFRVPGVLEGAQSTVRQADELLNRLTQKFPDPATLAQRVDTITERATQGMTRAQRSETSAKVREMVRIWDDGNRAILDTMGDEAPAFVRAVNAQITGNVADSWLTTAMQRRSILSNALKSEVEPKVANRIADALFNKEMIEHYKVADPSKLPDAVQEMIRQTKSLPYEQGVGAVETLVQRAKNTQFGLADMGVFGVNALNNIRRGGVQALAGGINRGLSALHLPHVDVYADNPILDRKILAALDGVHQGTTYGATVPDKGSLLQYGGKYAQALDRQIDKVVVASNNFQFSTILGTLRNADYEGNLVMLKLLGRDIENPLVRSQAAANANHLSGFANGALKRGRATAEGIALTSSSMTRARIAQVADLAKLVDPRGIKVKGYRLKGGPSAEQRIMAALGIVSTVGYTLAVGKLLNDRIGITDFIFDPSLPGFGTITTADGRTHDFVPQDSVERAFAKSIRAIAEMDENTAANVAKAWGNVLIGSSSIVARAPAAGFGVGYQPGRGYRYGDWGDGMSGGEKAAALLPIPPIGTDIATQGLSPVGTTETFVGIGNYPAFGSALAKAGKRDAGTPEQQFEGIPAESWRVMGQVDVFEAEAKGYPSYGAWYAATVADIESQITGVPAPLARQIAEDEVSKLPIAQEYTALRNALEDQWTAENPDLRLQQWAEEMRKRPGERMNLPRKPEREIIQATR